MPEETLPEETTTTVEEVTTTSQAPEETTTTLEPDLEPNLEPLDEEEVQALVAEATTIQELQEIFEELTPEQVEQVVQEILSQEEPSQEQAVALATSPEVLAVISVDNAEKVFEALQVDELTVEQVSELIEAIQSAPEEIRTQFETSIDIFGSDLGDYVPVGSSVPVDTRRTLIAVAAGAAMATVSSRKF
jgi:(2Fe-2S) ferredoxin